MTTLFDVILGVYRELAEGVEIVATAGAVGSITDTVHLKDNYKDDYFNRGVAMVWYDAGGANGAPEGEYAIVSDFVESTGVLTLETNLTAAVAAGDFIRVMKKSYRLQNVIAIVNRVLVETKIPKVDTTSIDTAAEQLEYDLPSTFRGEDKDLEVYLQAVTDDSNANEWYRVHDWYILQTATGTAKKLVFTTQPDHIVDVMLRWSVSHPALSESSDTLDEYVPPDLVILKTAIECLKWNKRQPGVENDEINKHIKELEKKLTDVEWRVAVPDVIKLATLGKTGKPYTREES